MLLVLLLSAVNTVSWRDPIHVYYARPRRPGRPEHPVAHGPGRRIPLAEQRLVERQGAGGPAGREPGLGGAVRARAGGRARRPAGVVVAIAPDGAGLRHDGGRAADLARALLPRAQPVPGAGHGADPGDPGLVLAAPAGGGPVGAGRLRRAGGRQPVAAAAQPGPDRRLVLHRERAADRRRAGDPAGADRPLLPRPRAARQPGAAGGAVAHRPADRAGATTGC